MGHAVSSGSADALSLTRITSDSQADQLYGKGSMLAEMLKMLRRANTYTETWAMPVAAPEGAAAKATLTVLGTATEAGTVALLINGVSVQVSVSAGATKENIAKAIADAVTKKPATQVAAAVKDDATDTVELTVNWHGVTGNGADAVAAIGPEWFTDIIAPFTDTKSLNTLRDELLNRWGPLKMMEAQLWTAFRGTHGETGTFGETRNDWLISCIGTNLSPHPAWMWAASYGATAAYHLAIDPARPLQTLVLTGILPPARNVRWDMPERNLLLHDGIATHMVDAGDNVCIEREITMYRVNQYGDEDVSYLDVQSPATLGRIRYIIKNRFTNRYPRHKLADDDVLDSLDAGQPVMTPKLCTAELLDICQTELLPAGLVENFSDYRDTLQVTRDSSDKNRLNFICHPNLVNQLRVLAGLIQFKL